MYKLLICNKEIRIELKATSTLDEILDFIKENSETIKNDMDITEITIKRC